jgi:hypothetical protein
MQAYGQGANTQLGGVNAQTGVGQAQTGIANANTAAGTAQTGNASAQGALGTSQMAGSQGQSAQGNAATGGLLSAVGGLFSDEKVKEDVKTAHPLDEILSRVRPVSFKYKPEMEQGPGEHVGVIAQDLEKTPLKENVIDTPAGKMIDTPKQENSNLNLIVEMAGRIKELEDQIGGKNA